MFGFLAEIRFTRIYEFNDIPRLAGLFPYPKLHFNSPKTTAIEERNDGIFVQPFDSFVT